MKARLSYWWDSMLKVTVVDVLYFPWCFVEVPKESYRKQLEGKYRIKIREFNVWEIEDAESDSLPEHILQTVKRLRDPSNLELTDVGGGLFFLDGKELSLSPAWKWPQVERILENQHKES